MKKTLIFLLTSLILNMGCKESDPCEVVLCENDGTCINGVCECSEWYGGDNCSESLLPRKMIINQITVTLFLGYNNSTTDWWDPQGNVITRQPDMYLAITDELGSTTISSVYPDCPDGIDYPFYINWDLDYDKTYTIRLMDDDNSGINGDDQMGIGEIIPNDFNAGNLRPTFGSMNLYDQGINSIELDINWER